MTLTYWLSVSHNDPTYNLRAKTKRELIEEVRNYGYEPGDENYATPIRVSVEYQDGLDLLNKCLCEGGASWER